LPSEADGGLLFPAEALQALSTPGIAARWNAVQEQLHPRLVVLAEHMSAAAAQRFPRQWPLYEVSFKSQRYVNRGRGERAPIDDYHVALDRPPRGAGILISVSGEERAVLVGLQLWGVRKEPLRQVYAAGRDFWHPLVERIEQTGQARFVARPRPHGTGTADTASNETQPWIERYLAARSASYLWAGFVYSWDSLPNNLTERIAEDVLELFPLNEALMEQAELPEPHSAALLRERRASFTVPFAYPSIDEIIGSLHSRGFAISETLVRAYHVALQTRPLAILPGISGTGKTRLTRLYADAVHRLEAAADNPYYLLVAVQPDWHNARDLLGYYNALTGLYHPTPFLRFLLRAAADPQTPYFVCLDEMNLARPEYYLAPLLSALETVDHTIDLAVPADEVQTVTGEMLPNPLRLPLNVCLTGTVNVDESTYALSDKLLDRANVIELTDVDLPAFRATYQEPLDEEVWQTIVQIHELATRAGQPFGYRTIRETLRYLEQASGVMPQQQALDLQIKQKVLPRLRGEDTPRLRQALHDLLALLLGVPAATWSSAAQVPPAQLAAARFPGSAEKVRRMLERLEYEGFTDFYG
jgi:hypothetical protein